jgi:hypothetical protein
VPINGFQDVGESMLAIDFSPAGQLYGIGGVLGRSTRRLYTIEPSPRPPAASVRCARP